MGDQPVAGGRSMTLEETDRLAALFEVHAGRLYRLARRLVPSADDALDLVQDTFLKAARSPGAVPRGSSNEEAWLVRVLVNTRRDGWRKEAVRRRHDVGTSRLSLQYVDADKTFVIRTTVWRALNSLSPRRRAVIVMSEIDGIPASSIARLLGISAITVRWHLSRGRRELARRLGPELGDSPHEHSQKPLAGRRSAPSRTPTS